MDFTGPQIYRGLAGMFIVRDDVEDGLPLPKGDKHIPLLICDRAFNEDGSFRYPSVDPTLLHEPGVEGEYHQSVEGDVILVKGAPWPELEVDATRYRFRVLNASNARRYDLRLDPPPPDGAAFVQVGSDVGLLGEPQALDQILLANAERAATRQRGPAPVRLPARAARPRRCCVDHQRRSLRSGKGARHPAARHD